MGEGRSLTHLDENGRALMVDISDKAPTRRTAEARGVIRMSAEALEALRTGSAAKGDVLALARAAGIMAVKKVPGLIPLCHQLSIAGARIEFETLPDGLLCRCMVAGEDRTGFEMEALTGVSVALLTVYDMLKALDRSMVMEGIRLSRKSGGRSGEYIWQE